MWNHSEREFEKRWKYRWHRFGLALEEGGIDNYKLPALIRFAPDYTGQIGSGEPFLVEVQGTGKDRTHKFKKDKLDIVGRWNKEIPVVFWLWDDTLKTETVISYPQLRLLVARGLATEGKFDGKRPYWALPVEVVNEHSDWDIFYRKMRHRG